MQMLNLACLRLKDCLIKLVLCVVFSSQFVYDCNNIIILSITTKTSQLQVCITYKLQYDALILKNI